MNAIPTRYNGVQFRSRLEAKWAAMFDLLEWKWEYEPLDLAGYIPDFLVDTDQLSAVLIEVKPVLKLGDYEPAQEKIRSSGWIGSAACVGAIIGVIDMQQCIGTERYIELNGNVLWMPWLVNDNRLARFWREAGNRVQWRAPT